MDDEIYTRSKTAWLLRRDQCHIIGNCNDYDRTSVGSCPRSHWFFYVDYVPDHLLGLEGLGEQAEIGSSFIVMTIASGALFPRIMGYLADTVSMQSAYIVPLVSFVVVGWFSINSVAEQNRVEATA